MSEDQLFPWPVKERASSTVEPDSYLEVKLRPPWILIGKQATRPCAHLPDKQKLPYQGSTFTLCDAKKPTGRHIKHVEGEPMVPVCPQCYILAARRGLL